MISTVIAYFTLRINLIQCAKKLANSQSRLTQYDKILDI